MRKYKKDTRWCVWRWTYQPEADYIVRLHVLQTPYFGIYVHYLNHADIEPYLHDHPRTFLSLIWRGNYLERRVDGTYWRRWFNVVRATDCHTIINVAPRTVTLAVMGPVRQQWGFFTPAGKVFWKDYYAPRKAAAKENA